MLNDMPMGGAISHVQRDRVRRFHNCRASRDLAHSQQTWMLRRTTTNFECQIKVERPMLRHSKASSQAIKRPHGKLESVQAPRH